jgi:hypothetical protein
MSINNFFKKIPYFKPEFDIGNHSEMIRDELQKNKPSMIARFGSSEIVGTLYPSMPFVIKLLIRNNLFKKLRNNAGFFSVSDSSIDNFSKLMINDMKLLDILVSSRYEEKLLVKNFPEAPWIEFTALEPYYSKNPWSEVLEGLKVLVVHPFSTSIERQYHEKRTLLFEDKRVLPQFKTLETVRAVQTIAGNKGAFDTWFDALESMKAAIDAKDYDVAIIGCGAYGFPLAAHVKRSGKKAIHLGGATQILFGIKGRRWDNHPVIAPLYNEHWVRPAPEDVPTDANKVENGCYW